MKSKHYKQKYKMFKKKKRLDYNKWIKEIKIMKKI